MWKNFNDKKRLTKFYFVRYEIKGLNLNKLINHLQKRKIKIYKVKKLATNKLNLSIKAEDNEKFFAIIAPLCYTINKIGEYGKYLPFINLLKNVGVFLGCLVFLAFSFISNDFIFSVDYKGNGKIYSQQVTEFLQNNGVIKNTRFSSVNLKNLSKKILANFSNLSFVECQKVGNRLSINLILAEEKVSTINNNLTELKSNVNGVVEKIVVYRGNCLVNVGDKVNEGDVLVNGEIMVNENVINVNVLAYANIITEKVFTYVSTKDNEETYALIFAEEFYEEKEIISSKVIKETKNDEFIYTVTLTYKITLVAG